MLPPKVRKNIYIGLGVVATILTAAIAGYAVSPYDVPWIISSLLAGVGVLAGVFSAIAANNVQVAKDEPVEDVQEEVEPD